MKSMKYKVTPFETAGLQQKHMSAVDSNIKDKLKQSEFDNINDEDSDGDVIEKDFESIGKKSEEPIEMSVAASNLKKHDSHDQLSHSDTASSSESGFGTVDDEIENNIHEDTNKIETNTTNNTSNQIVHQYQPLQQKQNQMSDAFGKQTGSNDSGIQQQPQQHQQADKAEKYQQPIKLPTLQGPRQIIYELKNKSDDITNILNDNSSINSTSSSVSTGRFGCCKSAFSKLKKFYCSCFCCYSTSWLSIFCCCCPLLGCLSLYFTNRSKKLKLKHNYAKAERYSDYAEKLNIAALIFGIIFYAIALFLIALVINMYWRNNNH